MEYLANNDMEGYIKKLMSQLDLEAEYYGKAQDEVKSVARLNDTVFLSSHNEYSNDKQSVRDTIEFSLASPFKATRGFSKKETLDLFKDCASKALAKVSDK